MKLPPIQRFPSADAYRTAEYLVLGPYDDRPANAPRGRLIATILCDICEANVGTVEASGRWLILRTQELHFLYQRDSPSWPKVREHLIQRGLWYIVDGAPGDVCSQCGEASGNFVLMFGVLHTECFCGACKPLIAERLSAMRSNAADRFKPLADTWVEIINVQFPDHQGNPAVPQLMATCAHDGALDLEVTPLLSDLHATTKRAIVYRANKRANSYFGPR